MRILQRPSFGPVAVEVPAPPAWDRAALAAYEQSFRDDGGSKLDRGRRDLHHIEGQLVAATGSCLAAIDAARTSMVRRSLEIAEEFVTTTLRHKPEVGVAGMLVRLGEVLNALEPDPLELAVTPGLVDDVEGIIATRSDHAGRITVIGDPSMAPGEFRLRSEWADAEGTFQKYMSCARAALETMVAEDRR